MSVDFVSCTPSDSAAWSLLVGCIICSKQHYHCCWPCSCTMLLGSILTPYSIVLCICRFCGLYMYSLRLAPQWFTFTSIDSQVLCTQMSKKGFLINSCWAYLITDCHSHWFSIVGWWLHGSAQPQNITPYVTLLLSCAAPDVRPINNSLRVESVDVHSGRPSVTLFFEVSWTGYVNVVPRLETVKGAMNIHEWLEVQWSLCVAAIPCTSSGGSRNLEGGFSHWCTKRSRKFFGSHAHFRYVNAFITSIIIVATDW